MSWLRRNGHRSPVTPAGHDNGLDEAHAALDAAMSRWPEVIETRENMKRIRQENHLAEKVDEFLRTHRR